MDRVFCSGGRFSGKKGLARIGRFRFRSLSPLVRAVLSLSWGIFDRRGRSPGGSRASDVRRSDRVPFCRTDGGRPTAENTGRRSAGGTDRLRSHASDRLLRRFQGRLLFALAWQAAFRRDIQRDRPPGTQGFAVAPVLHGVSGHGLLPVDPLRARQPSPTVLLCSRRRSRTDLFGRGGAGSLPQRDVGADGGFRLHRGDWDQAFFAACTDEKICLCRRLRIAVVFWRFFDELYLSKRDAFHSHNLVRSYHADKSDRNLGSRAENAARPPGGASLGTSLRQIDVCSQWIYPA